MTESHAGTKLVAQKIKALTGTFCLAAVSKDMVISDK